MKIVFRCDPTIAHLLPKPMPAREGLPDWLKSMPRTAFSDFHGQDIRTVKQCPPFIDAMSTGFLIPLPCDVMVEAGRFSWDWPLPPLSLADHPRSPLSFHVSAQLEGSPLFQEGRPAIKFNSFWTIELEEGWSLLAMHPANRLDLPFRLLTGVVGSTTSASSFPRSGPMPASPACCPRARRSPIAFPLSGRNWRWNSPSFLATRQSALRQ
jgi:hypothetical protein